MTLCVATPELSDEILLYSKKKTKKHQADLTHKHLFLIACANYTIHVPSYSELTCLACVYITAWVCIRVCGHVFLAVCICMCIADIPMYWYTCYKQ